MAATVEMQTHSWPMVIFKKDKTWLTVSAATCLLEENTCLGVVGFSEKFILIPSVCWR